MSLSAPRSAGQAQVPEYPLIPEIPMPNQGLTNWKALLEEYLAGLDFATLIANPRITSMMVFLGLPAIRPLWLHAVHGSEPLKRALCVVMLEQLLATLPEEDRALVPNELDIKAVKALVSRDLEPWLGKHPDAARQEKQAGCDGEESSEPG